MTERIPHKRAVLRDSGIRILMYENGDLMIGCEDYNFDIVEVINRKTGGHIHFKVRPLKENPKKTVVRKTDQVIDDK